MKPITATRVIDAPLEVVFETVSDIRNYARAAPHITNVEFLSEQQVGKGTRFRETRLMNGREATTELEVTEYEKNDRVRLVADSGGTIWDSIYTFQPTGDKVELKLTMEAREYKFMARVFIPLFRGKVVEGVEHDMDVLKEHCETSAAE